MSWRGNYQKFFTLSTVLLTFCVFNIGCGSNAGRTSGEFDYYVSGFEKSFARYHGVHIEARYINIQRGSLDKSQLAYCTLTYVSPPSITVNQVYWDGLSNDIKEVVMYHELGHCVLHRKHNNRPGSHRLLESVMAQRPEALRDYAAHREEYLQELFLSTTSTPDEG